MYTSNCKTIATRCHHRDASSLFYPCQSQSLQFSCVITYCSSIKGCYLAVYSLKYNSTEGNPILGKQVFNYYCLTGQELIFAFFSPLYTIVPQNSFLYLGYTDCFCRLGIKILKWLLEKVHSSSSNILFNALILTYCQYSDGYQMNGGIVFDMHWTTSIEPKSACVQ